MHLRRFISSALCVTITASAALAAELPVRSVILYKHGVGYFERAGNVGPGESARLVFKAAEMNDVLKSLTITAAGAKVSGVRYDSNVPLPEKLNEFPFRLEEGQPLSAVFDQLKGARIELDFGGQKLAGEIVAARIIPGEKERPEREQITLLTDSGDLRNVDLSAASSIRFTDPALQLQFRDYLKALTGSRSNEKRSVYIDSTDAKARDLRASYIMPMPAWKSSYRLIFDAEAQPTLEGWAIVDNTTGDDWTNVRLSLISGKPISFISQLYDPKYIARRSAELAEDEAVVPTVHSGAVTENSAVLAKGAAAGGAVGGFLAPQNRVVAAAPRIATEMAVASDIRVEGKATEIADLFEYAIAAPVTVKKNESAMLPFLQQKVSGRKLIIYSDRSKPNPLSAAELTNNTGRTLDGGPVTVFDGGTYSGEALVETIKSGDKRFISYGVDLGTRITTKQNSDRKDVREIHFSRGILTARAALVETTTYSIRNVDARAKTLIIEHPVREGEKLIGNAKPVETSKDVYRFEVKLAANASVEFPVVAESYIDEQRSVTSITPDVLLVYTRNKDLPEPARRQLQGVADLKTQIAALDAERRSVESEIQSVTRDEERNRQNITSLSAVSGQQQLVQEYARKLAEQEAQIAKLRTRETQIDTQRTSLQSQLNAAIDKLDF